MSDSIAPTRRRDSTANTKLPWIDDVATELVLEYGGMILKDARRYSACQADAEDAYQRSLVILITKAPSTKPEELVPWLRVVVRREATEIAKRRQIVAERSSEMPDDLVSATGEPEGAALDQVDFDLSVEALAMLKPDQVRCLLAQADGLSYAEISEATGFSSRKVARCVNEGRRAFVLRVEDIASGSECERIDSILPRLAAREATAIDSAAMHLKNCAGCRKAVHDYREAPKRARSLFPPAIVGVSGSAGSSASLIDHIADGWHDAVDRIQGHAFAAHKWTETATAKKAVAVAAVTATVVTGGAVVKHARNDERELSRTPPTEQASRTPTHLFDKVDVPPVADKPRRKKKHRRAHTAVQSTAPAPQPAASAPQQITKNEPVGDGSAEFLPERR
jgi:RNA polymerase sigma factor (sigma-70 family)